MVQEALGQCLGLGGDGGPVALGLPKDTPNSEVTRVVKERLIKPLGVDIVEAGPVRRTS